MSVSSSSSLLHEIDHWAKTRVSLSLPFELQVLQSLRTSVSSSGNPLSEAEMDRHTLKGLREGIFSRESKAFCGASSPLRQHRKATCV